MFKIFLQNKQNNKIMKKYKSKIIDNKYLSEISLIEKKIFINDNIFTENNNIVCNSVSSILPLVRKIYPTNTINLKEKAVILILNNKLILKGYSILSIGTENECYMDPRQIFKICLKSTSSNFVLIHNHPSGGIHPSDNDMFIFKKIKEGAEILNLRFIENLIITEESYFSFKEHGLYD